MGARLNYYQQKQLDEQGFVCLRGIVPHEMTDAALRAIHLTWGAEGLPPENLPFYNARSYCPDLCNQPPINNLLYGTPLWELAETLIGAGRLLRPDAGQIALRFPKLETETRWPHIDGVYEEFEGVTNNVAPNTLRSFTALLGVFLSDVPQTDAGNFTVWPGTHRAYEAYFRRAGYASLFERMPPIDLPPAHQIRARAGDAVLCHYQLGHHFAPNLSPHIRYAVFFRLEHVNHQAHKFACLTDIWREWEGLRAYRQHSRTRLRQARRYYAKALRLRLHGWWRAGALLIK